MYMGSAEENWDQKTLEDVEAKLNPIRVVPDFEETYNYNELVMLIDASTRMAKIQQHYQREREKDKVWVGCINVYRWKKNQWNFFAPSQTCMFAKNDRLLVLYHEAIQCNACIHKHAKESKK